MLGPGCGRASGQQAGGTRNMPQPFAMMVFLHLWSAPTDHPCSSEKLGGGSKQHRNAPASPPRPSVGPRASGVRKSCPVGPPHTPKVQAGGCSSRTPASCQTGPPHLLIPAPPPRPLHLILIKACAERGRVVLQTLGSELLICADSVGSLISPWAGRD